MLTITRYSARDKHQWDQFIATANNAVFLFTREYLDHHAERFVDHSLMFYNDGRLIALLPASLHEADALFSHGGLPFGGVVSNTDMTAPLMIEIFALLCRYLSSLGARRLVYKAAPHIYHNIPAEEDRYALFRAGARVWRREVTLMIARTKRPLLQVHRHHRARVRTPGITVRRDADLGSFWTILEDNLWRNRGGRPTHSRATMSMLIERFRDNIKLFTACRGREVLAGVVVFETPLVAHVQYIAANEEGKRLGALDSLFSYLLSEQYHRHPYFDFGTCTEEQRKLLNIELDTHKKSFGARALIHDLYDLDPNRAFLQVSSKCA